MKIKILKINVFTANYEGKAYEGQYGPMQRVVIKASSPDQIWGIDEKLSNVEKLGGPVGRLHEGDMIDVSVEQKNGFWNFKVIKGGEDAVILVVKTLQDEIERLKEKVNDLAGRIVFLEINKKSEQKEDIPF